MPDAQMNEWMNERPQTLSELGFHEGRRRPTNQYATERNAIDSFVLVSDPDSKIVVLRKDANIPEKYFCTPEVLVVSLGDHPPVMNISKTYFHQWAGQDSALSSRPLSSIEIESITTATRSSQVVCHSSTILALWCLILVFERELVNQRCHVHWPQKEISIWKRL